MTKKRMTKRVKISGKNVIVIGLLFIVVALIIIVIGEALQLIGSSPELSDALGSFYAWKNKIIFFIIVAITLIWVGIVIALYMADKGRG